MTKAGQEILEGMRDVLAFMQGDKTRGRAYTIRTRKVDVKKIRRKLGMTQEVFARTFAFSLSTLKKWELGEREPEGPAKAYLYVIDKNPEMVMKSLN